MHSEGLGCFYFHIWQLSFLSLETLKFVVVEAYLWTDLLFLLIKICTCVFEFLFLSEIPIISTRILLCNGCNSRTKGSLPFIAYKWKYSQDLKWESWYLTQLNNGRFICTYKNIFWWLVLIHERKLLFQNIMEIYEHHFYFLIWNSWWSNQQTVLIFSRKWDFSLLSKK